MKRAARIQAAPAKPEPDLLTDWIPCTTPPVRDGVYEVRNVASGSQSAGWRAEFHRGQWRQLTGAKLMDHTMEYPGKYLWRGVRRWILVRKADPLLSALFGTPTDAFLEDARPRSAKFNVQTHARPFESERAAQRFADRYSDLGLTAVLP